MWAGWRDRIAEIAGPDAVVFSAGVPRLPQTVCLAVPRVPQKPSSSASTSPA
jgi:hypothetical protein